MCELQQGAQIAFSTDGAPYEFLGISRYSAPIPVIDDADLEADEGRKKCPGELEDPQIVTLTLRNIGTQIRPTKGLVQTLTRTNKLVAGGTTPEIFAGTGFIVDIREPEFSSDSEDRQILEVDWQFDANPLPVRTLAT